METMNNMIKLRYNDTVEAAMTRALVSTHVSPRPGALTATPDTQGTARMRAIGALDPHRRPRIE